MTHIGMMIFLGIYILSSVSAEDVNYCAIPVIEEKVDKEAYIELVIKRYASQTKGLILYFDGSELFEKIPNSNLAAVMLPYGTSSNENDFVLSLVLAVVDVKQKNIVQGYFHKNIAQSDAIYISDIILDTKTFKDISKHTTFAVTIQHLGSSRPNPYANYNLYMYSLKDGKLSLILDTFEVMESSGENDTVGTGYEISKTLTYKTHKTSKEYDTLIFDSLSKRVDFDYSDDKSEEIISGVVRKEMRLHYMDGKYVNIDLKHLEFEATEGKVHSKTFYVELLEKMPITKDNVRTYNDMAYYLEQANHNEESIVILDEVLRKVQDRVVAYLNIADAYWKQGDKFAAFLHYSEYAHRMHKKRKLKRMPSRVEKRIDEQETLLRKVLIGTWKGEDNRIKITIGAKNKKLFHRVKTAEHTWKGKVELEASREGLYIMFSNVRWSEFRGHLRSEKDWEEVGKPQELDELPMEIAALFDWENEEFVIQNYGNGMNYYVKFKESDKKFIYFRKEKR